MKKLFAYIDKHPKYNTYEQEIIRVPHNRVPSVTTLQDKHRV